MADEDESEYRRGKPRTVKWRDSKGDEKSGVDLSDVLRDIFIHEMEMLRVDNQVAQGELIGVAQSTVSRFVNGASPMKSDELSKLCILLDKSPVRLFGEHPLYYDDARSKMVFPKDHLYSRFNALLRNGEAHDLIEAIHEAHELGVTREALNAVRIAVDAAKTARRAAARKARRPRSGRRIPKQKRKTSE